MAAKHRIKDEHDTRVTQAYRIAAWTRTKEMPRLRDVLGHRQTAEEQRAIWRQAADSFGFTVRKHDKRRVRIIRPPRREASA